MIRKLSGASTRKKMGYEISRVSGAPVSDEELLRDLQRVAAHIGKQTVGQKEYRELGTFDDSTVSRRFGSWNQALTKAGLDLANRVDLSEEQLFENLLKLWTYYGRQPRRRELGLPPSTISQSPYSRRFGSWSAALKAFVHYARGTEQTQTRIAAAGGTTASTRRTPRDPSLRLRYRVLRRDNFCCKRCGATPAKNIGVELHIDHVVPWSRGGETFEANLMTLCGKCNLGKSDTE